MLTKKILINIWNRHGFRAKKRLGQNFLIDRNIRDKIIRLVDPGPGDDILEIGPGFGELTIILAEMARKVVACEKDRKITRILREDILAGVENVEIVDKDILCYDSQDGFDKIVGNLPYYITTPIIEKYLTCGCHAPMFFMVQREYGARLTASAGDKDYSSLSCFAGFYSNVTKLLLVKKGCFFPEPKVDSIFIRIDITETPKVSVRDKDLFFRIVRGAFGQRRKTIVSSLYGQGIVKMSKAELITAIERIGLGSKRRPEELSIHNFAELANILAEREDKGGR